MTYTFNGQSGLKFLRGTNIVFLVLCLLLSGCTFFDHELYPDRTIRREGVYSSNKYNVVLEVKIKGGEIYFNMSDTSGHDISNFDQPRPGIHSKFFLVFDSSANIWLYSSDIGYSVFLRRRSGEYTHSLFNDSLARQAPRVFDREVEAQHGNYLSRLIRDNLF